MDSQTLARFRTHDGRPKLALMWRGDIHRLGQPTNHAARLEPLMSALALAGVDTAPLVYFDSDSAAARRTLLQSDGVMVWINPVQNGEDRSKVDALLRDVASAGVWVSAHPETILRMGTKEVLFRTRDLGWGSDTDLYGSFDDFSLRFPARLSGGGARVLKPLRGNDGQGVLKVDLRTGQKRMVRIQRAADDGVEDMALDAFLERMRPDFAGGAPLIDQAFQANVGGGMVRCYMSLDRVVGFSEQAPRQEDGSGVAPFGMNSAKMMHGAEAETFRTLRALMEQEWTPAMALILGLAAADLPALWDADFLYRAPHDTRGESEHVLCEINVSSVLPFPDVAAPAIASNVAHALRTRPR